MVTVMVHSGSVSIGHLSGGIARDEVRALHPKTLKHPGNGIFPLPEGERYRQQSGRIWDSLHNAANFAFANRMFLAMMAWEGLRRVHGDISFSLLYDAPHNFLWKETIDGRKSTFTAKAPVQHADMQLWPALLLNILASRCSCLVQWVPAVSS